MKYKAVIFDFNGTLFWDTAYHNQAWDIFLQKHKISLSDEEKAVKIHGKTNSDILKSIFSINISPEKIQYLSIEKELIYQDICLQKKMDYAPGAIEFFMFLKSRQIRFTIATSSGWENIEFYLKYMDLGKWFQEDCMVYDNGSFLGKPNPDIFLMAMDKLGVHSHEVLIFEDSPTGILAAENANAGKIIVVNSTGVDYSHFPYQVIRSFDEVDRSLF
jgi:beta-phosphoglucomutase-like phosphatase (HAD superfamily)